MAFRPAKPGWWKGHPEDAADHARSGAWYRAQQRQPPFGPGFSVQYYRHGGQWPDRGRTAREVSGPAETTQQGIRYSGAPHAERHVSGDDLQSISGWPRGADSGRAILRTKRGCIQDIVAASKDQNILTVQYRPRSVLPTYSAVDNGSLALTLAVPSLLFEDVTIRKTRGETPTPPVAGHPFFSK